jgi:hypothetical protein
MKRQALLFIGLAALAALAIGCGTTVGSDLAGVSASFNLAQKNQVIGVTMQGNGSNAVTVGVGYTQGSNSYSGSATISSNAVTIGGDVRQGTNEAGGSFTIPAK